MIAFVLATTMMASPSAERPISPAAAEALRAASDAAGHLQPTAGPGSPDVRQVILYRVHRLQAEAGLWADAAATAERITKGTTARHGRVILATSLALAGAINEAAAIADVLEGVARDEVLVVIAAERAKTDPGAARAIAAELAERADAPTAWAGIGSTLAAAGNADGAVAAFAEATRVAQLIPESNGFLAGRTVSRSHALNAIADRQAKAGRLDDALATVDLLKALQLTFEVRPADMTRAWAGRRADLLRAARRLDEAGQALQAVTDPPADAVLALAEAYGRAGRQDRAARWLTEARRQIDAMAPETNRTWSLAALAEAQSRLGLTDAARATLDEAQAHALRRPPDVFEPGHSLNRVIQARVAAGDLDGAARGVMILGDRHRVGSLGQIVAAWSVIGDKAAAEALLATIVDADSRARAAKPDQATPAQKGGPEPDADRAIKLAKEGKVDEAIAAALKIELLDTKVRALTGIAKAAPGSSDRAYLQMVELAANFDERSSGRPSIAAALADAGHPGLALEVMEPVREIPVGEWVLIGIAKAQAKAGDLDGARATIDGRLKTRAGRVPALCALARAFNDAGRRNDAVATLHAAESTAKAIEHDLAALATLATALHKAGRRDEARRWADRASDSVDSTVYAYVGGSDLGTVMYGRERRLEEVATIYVDLGLPARIWPLAARCDPHDDGVEACLRQAARAAAVFDPASVDEHRNDPATRESGRAAILLGLAEGLIANGRGK